jgi:6-phosphofructokinase 1
MDVPDFTILRLGEPRFASPVALSRVQGDHIANYVGDGERVIYTVDVLPGERKSVEERGLLERAGPRDRVFFDPAEVHAGIVTCGGLCPGLNDVIRSLVMTLWHDYGVRRIAGFRFGFRGLLPEYGLSPVVLSPEAVENIHRSGGTMLGSSRGNGKRTSELVDELSRMNCSVLFVIGGDGSQKGALCIAEEALARNLALAVVGVPKTIDNDLAFVQRSFGFESAVVKAVEAVTGAHVEAHDAVNGIAIVKLMGRESGFITAHTALGTNDVNYVLVPEVPFSLEGKNGLLQELGKRIARRGHALIVVAEGAGQELLPAEQTARDASGNRRLGDIGLFLRDAIKEYFRREKTEVNLKYIDPSYIIRSAPARPGDAIYCTRLGANAVHAAMTGRTGMIVSLLNDRYVHVPMRLAVSRRNRIDPESALWRDVIEATGQPPLLTDR